MFFGIIIIKKLLDEFQTCHRLPFRAITLIYIFFLFLSLSLYYVFVVCCSKVTTSRQQNTCKPTWVAQKEILYSIILTFCTKSLPLSLSFQHLFIFLPCGLYFCFWLRKRGKNRSLVGILGSDWNVVSCIGSF